MKTLLLILSIAAFNSLFAQLDSYKIARRDTIELANLTFKRIVALQFNEAIVLIDYELFMKKLELERNGLKKQIRSRERMIRKRTDYPGITSLQLRKYQRQFSTVDSVFTAFMRTKLDTLRADNNVFANAGSSFGDFLPSALERKQCMVVDLSNRAQKYIIKLSGSKKTGQMTAVGSSFYFIPGATRYFLSKMDWVS